MEYESDILKRLIKTYGVVGNPRYISEIIKEFIVQGKERFPELFTYQSDWLAHIDEFGLNPSYTVSYTGQSIYAPNTLERPVKRAILKGNTERILVGKNIFDKTSKLYDGWLYANGDYCEEIGGKFYTTDFIKVKPNTDIVVNNGGGYAQYDDNKKCVYNVTYGSTTTLSNTKYIRVVVKKEVIDTLQIEYGTVSTDYEEPNYGLQSVKMPVLTTSNSIVSNLMDYEIIAGRIWDGEDQLGNSTLVETDRKSVTFNHTSSSIRGFIIKKIPINNKTGDFTIEFTHTDKPDGWNGTLYANINVFKNGSFVKQIGNNATMQFDSSKNRYYYTFTLSEEYDWVNVALGVKEINNVGIHKFDNILIYNSDYKGLMANKTNILTVNEDVTLRSNGDICDELNLLTGQLTQRIGEDGVVLSQEVVKTVDLTILDQNGQNVKQLMSFNGGTHFNTGSQEGSLLPTISVDVVTDLEETLRVCSLDGNTM